MDLRSILNEPVEDVYAPHTKRSLTIKSEPLGETSLERLIDHNSMIKNLRHDLQETNERLSKIDKELSTFKETHCDLLERFENYGDAIGAEIKTLRAAEVVANQTEKRATRGENEEKRLLEQFSKLTIRQDAAAKTLADQANGNDQAISADISSLSVLQDTLQTEVAELQVKVKKNSDEADQVRVDYQRESSRAAELCREVEDAKELGAELARKASGEAMRLRAEQRDMDLQARDSVIDELSIQISNLEDTLRRLELDQQQRIAKYSASRPANGYSSRRTRSPAVSTLSRGCSPGTFNSQQSNSNNNSSSTSSGHPLQQSQIV
ncbi:hypothetical protein BZA70DRAFT_286844 [Myxozyma melibiosi]|uniref:SWI5-dependent HO expression protein 3 n=1 Tax=Myxozyma melibiosi TaxID=54550 RepID=A0ABR1FCA3_9ASCO